MAGFNEILVGRFSKFIQKHFGMKGPQAVSTLSPDVMAAILFRNGVENLYLEGWQRFGMWTNQPGVASNLSECVLRNPATSGVLAVLEKVLVTVPTTETVHFDTGSALAGVDKGTVYTPQILDRRGGAQTGSALVLTSGSTLGGQIVGTTILGLAQLLANTPWDFIWYENEEILLLPGDGAQVEGETVNTALAVGWIWRQRPIEDSETK